MSCILRLVGIDAASLEVATGHDTHSTALTHEAYTRLGGPASTAACSTEGRRPVTLAELLNIQFCCSPSISLCLSLSLCRSLSLSVSLCLSLSLSVSLCLSLSLSLTKHIYTYTHAQMVLALGFTQKIVSCRVSLE